MVSILMVSWERLDATIWWSDQSTVSPSAPQAQKLRSYWPELLLIGDFSTRVGSDHQALPSCLGHHGSGKMNKMENDFWNSAPCAICTWPTPSLKVSCNIMFHANLLGSTDGISLIYLSPDHAVCSTFSPLAVTTAQTAILITSWSDSTPRCTQFNSEPARRCANDYWFKLCNEIQLTTQSWAISEACKTASRKFWVHYRPQRTNGQMGGTLLWALSCVRQLLITLPSTESPFSQSWTNLMLSRLFKSLY